MLLLGLDTATAVTTVGLVRSSAGAGVEVLGERSHADPRRHGEVLPVQIDEVLRASGVQPSDLDAVATGTGPGAFTGLRVGLATGKAIGLVLDIPVFGLSTLDALAFATGREEPFAVVTDARRKEYFWATYERFDVRAAEPAVGTPQAVRQALGGIPAVCPPDTPAIEGLSLTPGGPPSAIGLCRAVLAKQAAGEPLDPPAPRYLRQPDVMPAAAPKSVLS